MAKAAAAASSSSLPATAAPPATEPRKKKPGKSGKSGLYKPGARKGKPCKRPTQKDVKGLEDSLKAAQDKIDALELQVSDLKQRLQTESSMRQQAERLYDFARRELARAQ